MAYISQEEKKQLAPGIKAVLKKYGMKGTIAIQHYSKLVVNLSKGPLDLDSVNVYWVDKHYADKEKEKNFLNELIAAMKGDLWYDNSDAMIDYFDTAYYIDINVGKWNKPYVKV